MDVNDSPTIQKHYVMYFSQLGRLHAQYLLLQQHIPAPMAMWSKVLPLTAGLLSPLPGSNPR